MSTTFKLASILAVLMALLAPLGLARGQVSYPPRIGDRDFVSDSANLLSPEDKAQVRATCEQLLTNSGTPLIVVTVNSMSDFGAAGWPIERYAMNLFDEWGIGHAGKNSGILLLVSKGDRKVRIELGSGWTHEKDTAASAVINNVIVPKFKANQYSEGIRAGVEALARDFGTPTRRQSSSLPEAPSPGSSSPMPRPSPSHGFVPTAPLHSSGGLSSGLGPCACIAIAIVAVIIISMISRIGRGGGVVGPTYGPGYGPMGWGGGWGGGGGGGFLSGAVLGGLLGNAWGSRHSGGSSWGGFGGGSSGGGFSGGGGGFSGGGGGGSFGGGFSGGGGATGSW